MCHRDAQFSKMPDLPEPVLDLPSCQKIVKSGGLPSTVCGHAVTEQKFNGAPYIIQRAGEAVYSEAGKAQTKSRLHTT